MLVVEIESTLDSRDLARLYGFEKAVRAAGGRRVSTGKTRVYLAESVEGGGKVDAAAEELRGKGFLVRRFVQSMAWRV